MSASGNDIFILTPGRRQLKTLLTINNCGSNIDRNSVFDCHLSLVSVSSDFLSTFVVSIIVFNCHLPGVILQSIVLLGVYQKCRNHTLTLFHLHRSPFC